MSSVGIFTTHARKPEFIDRLDHICSHCCNAFQGFWWNAIVLSSSFTIGHSMAAVLGMEVVNHFDDLLLYDMFCTLCDTLSTLTCSKNILYDPQLLFPGLKDVGNHSMCAICIHGSTSLQNNPHEQLQEMPLTVKVPVVCLLRVRSVDTNIQIWHTTPSFTPSDCRCMTIPKMHLANACGSNFMHLPNGIEE